MDTSISRCSVGENDVFSRSSGSCKSTHNSIFQSISKASVDPSISLGQEVAVSSPSSGHNLAVPSTSPGRKLAIPSSSHGITTNLVTHTPSRRHSLPAFSPNQLTSSLTSPTLAVASNRQNFECPDCHKTMKTHQGYTMHLDQHRGVYRYRCPECGKGLSSSTTLKEHMASSHTHIPPFSCQACGARFWRQKHLKKHRVQGTCIGDTGVKKEEDSG